MFGKVFLQIPKTAFDEVFDAKKKKKKAKLDTDLDAKALKEVIEEYKKVVKKHAKREFPQDPHEQLVMARDAVFRSWQNERAKHYRRINNIDDMLGTAVNVQAMVFGNMGETSGTGVGFTRNTATGAKGMYGEFLINAQGEDVVAGIRTPLLLSRLSDVMPEVYGQLKNISDRLEIHYKDIQDFEFTIQEGELFMLQTRSGKRTGLAAIRIACEMVNEGLLTPREALTRVDPNLLDQLLHPMFDPVARQQFHVVARGIASSPGAAAGQIVFSAEKAVELARQGERVLLVREETSPDDIAGMEAAQGFLTAFGGQTSHAAVVGRQMGKPAIVGCAALRLDEANHTLIIAGFDTAAEAVILQEGDDLSIDGTTGEVLIGNVPTSPSEVLLVVQGELDED